MQIKRLKKEDSEALEGFVQKHPHGSIEQSWAWGDLQTSIPGRPQFWVLALMEGQTLVASMLVIQQEMGRGKCWLWCPGGPLLPEKHEKAWQALSKELDRLAAQTGAVFARIEPSFPAEWAQLKDWRPTKEAYLPRNTLLLDLTLSEEELLAQMKQKGRYNIRKASKTGVSIKKGGLAELPRFYSILEETAKRDGFHLHEESFYASFLSLLGERVYFYLVYLEDECLGGMLVTHFGERATYYFGASSNAHRQNMAPYALQWQAIQEAKQAGCTSYDFLGIAPEGDAKHVLAGVTQFKTRFGGEQLQYAPAQVKVYKPFWWWVRSLLKWLR